MKVTKSYLKQVIKEELGHMEEVSVEMPKAHPATRTRGRDEPVSGPEAPGDEVHQAVYSTLQGLKFMLEHDPEQLKKIGGGFYYMRLKHMADELEAAENILKRHTKYP